ncbi:protealysin inhibitor emfourin [Saccharopolyspora shandongensis]|uniref:protealysin inhibitor emfourin n=1 Tax=Saccharopolyspora shandongensis TaxID=418495 RepID=UPI0033C210E8
MEGGRGPLRVSIVRGGGLAGLVITTAVDTSALTEEDAATLRDLVRAADLENVPPSTRAAMPDAQSYEITVESGETSRTVVLTERDLSAAVRSLITWIESVPGHERSVRPPG